MRIACALVLLLGSCGAKSVPSAAPSPPPDATLNAAPPRRDESPAPPQTDPVPILAPPQ